MSLLPLQESACGCAGIYSAPVALPLYAHAFEQVRLVRHVAASGMRGALLPPKRAAAACTAPGAVGAIQVALLHDMSSSACAYRRALCSTWRHLPAAMAQRSTVCRPMATPSHLCGGHGRSVDPRSAACVVLCPHGSFHCSCRDIMSVQTLFRSRGVPILIHTESPAPAAWLQVPQTYQFGDSTVVPLWAGQELQWQLDSQ